MHIKGSGIFKGLYVESGTNLYFHQFNGNQYKFSFIFSKNEVEFDQSSKIMVDNILSANIKSFNKILPILVLKKTTELQFCSSLEAAEMTVYPDSVNIIFIDGYSFNILTSKVRIMFAFPICNFVLKPGSDEPIQSVPDIVFYGEGDSGITMFNDWEFVTDWTKLSKKINIITEGRFTFLYETNLPILDSIFNITANETKYVTGIMGGEYTLVDSKYYDIFDSAEISFCVDSSSFIGRNFVPVNGRLIFNLYGFFTKNESLKMLKLFYPNINVLIRSRNQTSFVEIENAEVDTLKIEKTILECKQNIKIRDLSVKLDSDLIINGNGTSYINTAEIFGKFELTSGKISIEEKVWLRDANFGQITSNLVENNKLDIICICDYAPDEINWKEKMFSVTFSEKTVNLLYNKFRDITLAFINAVNNFQIKFSCCKFGKESKIENTFLILQENKSPLNLFFNENWGNCKANLHITVRTKSVSTFFIEGNAHLNTEVFDILPSPSATINTKGKYCIVKSGKNFSHCQKFDERVLSSLTAKRFWEPQSTGNKAIYFRTDCNCKFSSNTFPNNSQISIYGTKNNIEFTFDTNKISTLELNNANVVLKSENETIALQKLIFQHAQKVEIKAKQLKVTSLLRAQPHILSNLLPLTTRFSSLLIEDIFDGTEKSITLTKKEIAVKGSKQNTTFNLDKLKHIHFNIEKLITSNKSPLDVYINITNNSLVSQVFDVFSSVNRTNYINFPSYVGCENYVMEKERGKFSGKSKWVFTSKTPFLPKTIFDFPPNSTKDNIPFCVYSNNPSKCPKNTKKIQYKERALTEKDFDSQKFLEVFVCQTTEMNPFDFDISVFKEITIIRKSISDKTQNIRLPKQKIKELSLEGIDAYFVDDEINAEVIKLTDSILNANQINVGNIYGKLGTFSPLIDKLNEKTNIQVIADNYYSVEFSKESVKVGRTVFKKSHCKSIDLIYYKPLKETYPLNIVYSGGNGTHFELLPSFLFNFEDNVNIYFTESWEEITNKKDQHVYINSSRFSKVKIKSGYSTYPSMFSFNKKIFSPENFTNFCLVSSKETECPSSYKRVVYTKGVQIQPISVRPTTGKTVSYLIMESNEESFPIFPPNIFENCNVTISASSDTQQFAQISFKAVNSLILNNVNVNIESEVVPTITNLVLDKLSVLSTNKSKELHIKNIQTKSLDVLNILDKKSKCRLELEYFDDLNTVSINETHIMLKNKEVLLFAMFSDVIISCNTQNLFIDYCGSSKTVEFEFIPSFNLVGNREECSILFSENWERKNFTAKQKGKIRNIGNDILTVNSSSYGIPESLFSIVDEYTFKGKQKGRYCVYQLSKKNDFMNCDSSSILLPVKAQNHILELNEVEPDGNRQLFIYSTFNLTISSTLLSTKLHLIRAKSLNVFYTINCTRKQANVGSLEMNNCKVVFTGKSDVRLTSLIADEAELKGTSKFFIDSFIQTRINVINKLQPMLQKKTLKSHIYCTPSKIEFSNETTKADDIVLDYNKLGSVTLCTLSSQNIFIKSNSKTISKVCDIFVNGDTSIFFDKSLHSCTTKKSGSITNVGGTLTLRSDNISVISKVFIVPEERDTCIYEFGPRRTPTPTQVTQATPTKSPIRTPPNEKTEEFLPTKKAKYFDITDIHSFYLLAIFIVLLIMIIISVRLCCLYNREFDESRYGAFNMNNEPDFEAEEILEI